MLSKQEIKTILMKDYDYNDKQLEDLKKVEMEEILERERKNKTASTFSNFWVVKGMPKPEIKINNGKVGTEKYAWGLFIMWISMFVLFALFMFLMIYFFAI